MHDCRMVEQTFYNQSNELAKSSPLEQLLKTTFQFAIQNNSRLEHSQ